MGHTDLRDVQYGKIRINMQYAYNTVPYFMQFGSADFGPKMDPIRPKITRNVPNSFPVFYLLLMYYRIALKAHRKVVVGAEIA
jgi:hypothetical protein